MKKRIDFLREICKKAAPLMDSFDIHEDVQTSPKYKRGIAVRLKNLNSNIYMLNFAFDYSNRIAEESKEDLEFHEILKSFYKKSDPWISKTKDLEELVGKTPKLGDINAFLNLTKNFKLSNGKTLSQLISNPADATIIIRNVPDAGADSMDLGHRFRLNPFYYVHDIICHQIIESNKEMLDEVLDIINNYMGEMVEHYKTEDGLSLRDFRLNSLYLYYGEEERPEEGADFLIESGFYESTSRERSFEGIRNIKYNLTDTKIGRTLFSFSRRSGPDDQLCDLITALYMSPVEKIINPHKEHYDFAITRTFNKETMKTEEKKVPYVFHLSEDHKSTLDLYRRKFSKFINNDLLIEDLRGKVIFNSFYYA